nr:ionotropic receptor 75i [Graphosoma rubrolineatum]
MHSLVFLLLFIGSTYSLRHLNSTLEIITTYFNFRATNVINIYSCNHKEGVWLLKHLNALGFMIQIKHHTIDEKEESRPPYVRGWFVDLNCTKNIDFFRTINGLDGIWLGYPVKSLNLNLTKIRLDSDIVLGTEDGFLWDLYNNTKQQLKVLSAGTWRPPKISMPNSKYRYDLNGTVLKGVLLELELQFFKNNMTEKIGDYSYYPEWETSERLAYVYIQNLANFYNFEIEIVPSETWGYVLPNGSFGGMVGVIERGKADLGLTACAMREDRMRAVNFVPQLQDLRFICLFMEERIRGTYSALILPFSFNVWLCIFVAIVIGAAIFSLVQNKDVTEGIIFVTAILSQQGLLHDKNRMSARVYSISLLFLGLVLYSYYSAAIMNGLLSPVPPSIHNELELQKSTMKASIAKVPYLIATFSQKAYLTAGMFAKTREHEETMLDPFVGLDRVRKERLILISDDLALYGILKTAYTDLEKCNVREIETMRPFPLANPIRKDSPFREMIAQGMLRLQENGMGKRDRRVWYPPRPHCFASTIYTHVTLEAVGLAFTLYVLGIVLSFTILLSEVVMKRFKKFKKTDPDSEFQGYY